MSNWPQKWIDAVFAHTKAIHDYGAELDDIRGKVCENILMELKKAGALKNPPQPREIWWCTTCETGCPVQDDTHWTCNYEPMIKMREVV